MAARMTYDFVCLHCARETSMRLTLQEYLTAEYPNQCPEHECAGTLRRMIKTAPMTQFVGDGWADKRVEED